MHRPGGGMGVRKQSAREENCAGIDSKSADEPEHTHAISVALMETCAGIIPAMRTEILKRLAIGCILLTGFVARAADGALHADRVLVLKKQHTLRLLREGKVIKSYRVALGGDPVGAKNMQGDHKTPEGIYVLDFRNQHGQFYKSIHISYPNAQDRAQALQKRVSPGGDVFIHGLPNGYAWLGPSHRAKDWTDGCIAVTDAEMDEIWDAVADGTPIEIRR